jgi:iron complex outermembrane receptor protein
MLKRHTPTLLVNALLLPLCVQQSLAQTVDPAPSWRIEEIVVTGARGGYAAQDSSLSKADIALQDLPQSVQVLNRTLIDEQNLQSLSDALVNVSGVVPSDESESVLISPLIRGFRAEIYVDGMPSYGDTAVIDSSSLSAVERIEVAKGPSSTLYGGGIGAPVGGLINLVTRTPQPGSGITAGLLAGSFNTLAPSIDINHAVSDTIGLRLNAEKYSADDYIDDVSIDRLTLNPSLSVQLSARTSLLLRGLFSETEQREYSGLPAEVAGLPGVDPERYTGAPDTPPTEVRNAALHLTLEHAFNANWQGTLNLRSYDSEFEEYSSFAYPAFYPLLGTQAAIITGQLPADTAQNTLDATLNGRLTLAGMQHNVLVGATLDDTRYRGGLAFNFAPIGVLDLASAGNTLRFGAIPALNPATDLVNNDYGTRALYVQDQITLISRLQLLLSARYSRYSLQEDSATAATDEDYTEIDPRIGLTYTVNDSISAFAGYATGSRLSLYFNGAGGKAARPQTSRSVEAGLKLNNRNLGLSGTIAAYTLTRRGIPTVDPTDPFFGQIQAGEQESEGLELDLLWEPSPAVSVLASYGRTDAQISEPIMSFAALYPTGNALARVPRESARVAGRYRLLGGPLQGLGVGLGMQVTSSAPLTDANLWQSDDYTVFDLNIDYSVRNYQIALSVANLLDKEYFKPYAFLAADVLRPGQPRAVSLSLKATF